MDEIDYKELLKQAVTEAADEAVKKYREAEPKDTGGFQVEDEADRALKGNPIKPGEFFTAVKDAAVRPHEIDKRLLPLKATGLNEAIPSQGGFLVPIDVAAGIQQNMWGVGTVLSFFNPINVSGNGLTVNALEETSRADGYRQGGIRGYWLAEAGTKTATKPEFRQIDLKLKKVAALCYATDELLDDATALSSWITNNVPNELRFKVEQAIMNGDGVGKPLGILQSGALVSATRTDANEIDSFDVVRMWASRLPGLYDYVWFVSNTATVQLYNMTLGNMPVFMPPGGMSGAPYGTILGRPVIETEYNPSLGVAGDILLASPSQYALINKGGVQSASSIHVQFVADETVFRFVYRVDGQPMHESTIAPYYASTDAAISPFVVLGAST